MSLSAAYLEKIKGAVPLSQLIIADINIIRAGSEWKGLCPFHDEKSASFFVNDRKGFFHCFGCGAHGDAIDWLVRHRKLQFEDAVEALAGEKPPSDAQSFENKIAQAAREHAQRAPYARQLSEEQRSRQAQARAIWRGAKPFAGSLAETYLRSRAISLLKWPPTLRFVDRSWHGWEQTSRPALVGAVQDSMGQITAIQTIFLRADGMGKAGIVPPKPVTGPMGDGAVRLGKIGSILGIAEGIETALSARQIYSLPVWATLGASRLGSVKLPDEVQSVVIFADNGDRGKAEAEKAAKSYMDQDRTFQIEYPPEGVDDWNTQLQQTTKAA